MPAIWIEDFYQFHYVEYSVWGMAWLIMLIWIAIFFSPENDLKIFGYFVYAHLNYGSLQQMMKICLGFEFSLE